MAGDRDENQPGPDHRRGIRRTVALLAGVAALIYLGFIGRGVLG